MVLILILIFINLSHCEELVDLFDLDYDFKNISFDVSTKGGKYKTLTYKNSSVKNNDLFYIYTNDLKINYDDYKTENKCPKEGFPILFCSIPKKDSFKIRFKNLEISYDNICLCKLGEREINKYTLLTWYKKFKNINDIIYFRNSKSKFYLDTEDKPTIKKDLKQKLIFEKFDNVINDINKLDFKLYLNYKDNKNNSNNEFEIKNTTIIYTKTYFSQFFFNFKNDEETWKYFNLVNSKNLNKNYKNFKGYFKLTNNKNTYKISNKYIYKYEEEYDNILDQKIFFKFGNGDKNILNIGYNNPFFFILNFVKNNEFQTAYGIKDYIELVKDGNNHTFLIICIILGVIILAMIIIVSLISIRIKKKKKFKKKLKENDKKLLKN